MNALTSLLPFLLSLAPQVAGPDHATSGGLAAGTAWGDFDADGLPDALAIAPDGRAALFANAGDGSFRDHTRLSGLEFEGGLRGALWGDVDGDDRLDLLLLDAQGAQRLWRNLGDGTFADVTGASGLDAHAPLCELSWLDYDRDGLPDLLGTSPAGQALFHNAGAGRFERVELLEALAAGAPVVTTDSGRPVAPQPPTIADDADASESSAAPIGTTASPGDLPSGGSAAAGAFCSPTIADASLPGNCLPASTMPVLGALYPLSVDWYVDLAGNVGLGTTSPAARLDVAGQILGADDITSAGRLVSQTTSGPPLSVASNAKVVNLNADLLDGLGAGAFTQLGQSIEGSEISDGSVTSADLASSSVTGAAILNGTITASDLGANSVAASELASGAVSNTHVASSAAIAGSKIVPHFTQSVGIGTSSPSANLDVVGDIEASDLVSAGRFSAIASGSNTAVNGFTSSSLGKPARFEIQNSSSSQDVLRAVTNGTGRALFLTTNNPNATAPVIEAGTTGKNDVLTAITYGTAAAGYFEVQNTSSNTPAAVYVKTNGLGDGIQVHNSSTTSEGVYVRHTGGNAWGVWSTTTANDARSVVGTGTGSLSYGVYGSANIGVVGSTINPASYAILSQGDFAAGGNKNFVQPHPTQAGKEVVFTCLEGNESGTYFRGSADLSGGRAVVEVPEEFRLVSEAEDLTVQLTPVGQRAVLWVESQDLDSFVVRGDVDVTFHYTVNGVRRGFGATERIVDAKVFVPELRGVPFGAQYPRELRRILVENGTLNADFTPNEATAAARGWSLREPGERDLELPETAELPALAPAPSTVDAADTAPASPQASSEPAAEERELEPRGQSDDDTRVPVLLDEIE